MARPTRPKKQLHENHRSQRSCTKNLSYLEPATDEEEEDAQSEVESSLPRTQRISRKTKQPIRLVQYASDSSSNRSLSPSRKRRVARGVAARDDAAARDVNAESDLESRPRRSLRSSRNTNQRIQYAADSGSDRSPSLSRQSGGVTAVDNAQSDIESRPRRSLRSSRNTNQRIQYAADSGGDRAPSPSRQSSRLTAVDDAQSDIESRPRRTLRSSTRTSKPSALTEYGSDSHEYDDGENINLRRNRPRMSLRLASRPLKRSFSEHANARTSQDPDDEYQDYSPRKRRSTRSIPNSPRIIDTPKQSGKIPNWTSLPFSVLCQIFHYASSPVCDERYQRTNTTQWLLDTSRICRSFAEPCMQALYRSPPLAPMNHAHHLVQHLKADQNGATMSYRNKVESIQFEVSSTAALSFAGKGVLDLHGLIKYSTRLKDLEIYHEKDFAPYKNLKEPIRWHYPDQLFAGLDEVWTEEVEQHDRRTDTMVTTTYKHGPIKLRSWRWSSRLAGPKQLLPELEALHLTPKFNDLQKIAFVNYQIPDLPKVKSDNDEQHKEKLDEAISVLVQALSKAIKALPKLQHLIFESCPLLDSELLSLLPSSLQVLEIINCEAVEALGLTAYLYSKGPHLRELLLDRNESLNLSFLPGLATACPRLEVLRMNLHHDPEYQYLLSVDEVPTWPSSLRVIDLNPLRNWDIETAEMFFQSLVDSAAQLPHLRQLILKATLSINWKVRAGVRQKWEELMQKVFRSNRPLPNPSWTSIKAIEEPQRDGSAVPDEDRDDPVDEGIEDDMDFDNLPQRKSSRASRGSQQASKSCRPTRSSTPYNAPVALLERAKRTTRSGITYAEPETEESGDELAIPSTPEHANSACGAAWNEYSDLASPPSTVGRTRAGTEDNESHGAERARPLSRSRRQAVFPSSPPVSGADSDGEALHNYEAKVEPFVQGMCDKVDVTVSNLRPRQNHWDENDFLGGEADEGEDSEWDGDVPDNEEIAF